VEADLRDPQPVEAVPPRLTASITDLDPQTGRTEPQSAYSSYLQTVANAANAEPKSFSPTGSQAVPDLPTAQIKINEPGPILANNLYTSCAPAETIPR
jgi:hypothetical protein